MSRRIHTFTANLLWETTFSVGSWKTGDTVRASEESVQVGGKGINVSRMLNRLGAPNSAIIFPGGAVGAQCEDWLTENGIATRPFKTTGASRTGFVVRTPGAPETTFLGEDRPLDLDAVRSCCDYLLTLPDGDILAVCGSIPGWTTPAFDTFRETVEKLFRKLIVAADTYGPPLAWFAERPAGLIKINEREYRGLHAGSDAALKTIALETSSPRAWIVTDGKRKVKGIDSADGYWERTPPDVVEVSATGSGDVLFAALLNAHFNEGRTLPESADASIPLAAANACSPGIADYPERMAKQLSEDYHRLNS